MPRINVNCVYLASEMKRISLSWEKLSQYLAGFIIMIGVFRTLSNMMELFIKIGNGFYLPHHWCLSWFWMRLWSWYSDFSNENSLESFQNLFVWNFFWLFLRTTFKRKVWEVWVHIVRFFNKDLYLDIDPFLLIPWKNLRDAK